MSIKNKSMEIDMSKFKIILIVIMIICLGNLIGYGLARVHDYNMNKFNSIYKKDDI